MLLIFFYRAPCHHLCIGDTYSSLHWDWRTTVQCFEICLASWLKKILFFKLVKSKQLDDNRSHIHLVECSSPQCNIVPFLSNSENMHCDLIQTYINFVKSSSKGLWKQRDISFISSYCMHTVCWCITFMS